MLKKPWGHGEPCFGFRVLGAGSFLPVWYGRPRSGSPKTPSKRLSEFSEGTAEAILPCYHVDSTGASFRRFLPDHCPSQALLNTFVEVIQNPQARQR